MVHRLAGDYVSEPPSPPSALLQQRVGFVFEYERDDPLDPRELSELPDVRLWFVRLDTAYPWLPAVLDWRAGELGRYAAMLVPHQVGIPRWDEMKRVKEFCWCVEPWKHKLAAP